MLYLILMFLGVAVGASLLGHHRTASDFLLMAEILAGLFLIILVITGVRNYLKRKK